MDWPRIESGPLQTETGNNYLDPRLQFVVAVQYLPCATTQAIDCLLSSPAESPEGLRLPPGLSLLHV
jgi:hypothetical protein